MKQRGTEQDAKSLKSKANGRGWRGFVEQTRSDLERRKAKKQKESSADRASRQTATATVWIAGFTILLAIVAALQLYEIATGSLDTAALVDANRKQARSSEQISAASRRNATAAEGFTSDAGLINKQISAAVTKLDAQAKAIEASRRTSAATAQSALQATLDDFRLEQRPWVGISISNQEIVPTPGTKPLFNVPAQQVTVSAHNTGRTPAVFLQVFCCKEQDASTPGLEMPNYDSFVIKEDAHTREFFEKKAAENPRSASFWLTEEADRLKDHAHDRGEDAQSGEVIPPDGYREIQFTSIRNIPGDDYGRTFAYFMGKFLYRDVLGSSKVHATYFCVMQFRSSGFELCKHGQDMK